ncbi:gas vesicle protein GvpG, partial [Candidatus Hakubella thermalkaliphila]
GETVLEENREKAEYESDLESILKGKLLEIRMGYESGEISEEQYKEKEKELKKKLEAIGVVLKRK